MAWRTGLYWLALVDPTPEQQAATRGGAVWAQCRRCGVLENVLLPADLGDVLSRLRAICSAHERCRQTLLGARWELVVTLRNRLPLRRPESGGWHAQLALMLEQLESEG